MSDNPMGPYTFKGKIMEQSPTGCWTNHHSIVEYKGQWYLFYHHNDYSPEFDKRRSTRIDSLFFNADGTIQLVRPTLRGVGLTDARSQIQIDRYSDITPGASIAFLNEDNKFEGWKTILSSKDATIRYNNVDFGKEAAKEVTVRVKSPAGGHLQIALSGLQPFTMKLPPSKEWVLVKTNAPVSATGVHDLSVSLVSGTNVELDWMTWK